MVLTSGLELPPLAPSLMASLRSLGYSVEAALADLLDNSIAASADTVSVEFAAHPEPYVAVVDNGEGMEEQALIEAMRFGSRDPREARKGKDLGRFGLGLKTASLSQCRSLTVISLRGGHVAAAEWDLDACEERGTWWLRRPHLTDELNPFLRELEAQGRGTVVLWRKLDRLVPPPSRDPERVFDSAMAGVEQHLAFTFHRFIHGRESEGLHLQINGREVPHLDPFLEGDPRGQMLHEEAFQIDGHTVRVAPFVLPFPSKLSQAEKERAGGHERIKTGHGFYVYRGKRLVVPGGWFRIVPADELVRLARIRVDVPVELDHLWKVDIRKTVVEPPRELKENLRRVVGDAAQRSRRVYQFRGNAGRDAHHRPLWLQKSLRDGAVAWIIDRQHPAVKALLTGDPDDTERLFKLIEESIPFHDIHIHMSADRDIGSTESSQDHAQELEDLARRLVTAFDGNPDARRSFLENLGSIEPFSRDPDLTIRIAASLSE
ncbi:ATP-binding protein [Tistlia consotensis]|uniref:ATP-binding protein n=1 Tax=Tistlia consotensis TaxID=1321365 RepID=UPI001356466E|nr:ATP-binding protein [Tistlia consotensis]